MRFGSAKDLITPPFPTKLSCSGLFDVDFDSIHDDVFVRCLVIDDGKQKCALMAFDLLFHGRDLNRTLEEYAAKVYGFDPAGVIVGATHSHVSPAASGYNRNVHSAEYEAFLLERAKRCLDRAMCSMYEGTIEHTAFDAEFNISRRGIVNGKFTMVPNPSRPRDTEFSLLTVRDLKGNIRSVVMSYGCHPVFYPAETSISGEFPARVCQLLDAKFYGCTSLFFQSAGADVRPSATVVNGQFDYARTFNHIDQFAQDIFQAVTDQITQKGDPLALSIGADAFCLELPMDPLSLDGFREKLERIRNRSASNPDLENARYIVEEGGYETLEKNLKLHCQTVKLTDGLYIATMGGEPTSGVKNAVKAGFGDHKVFFIGYTDACAYIVNDQELAEGGYEPTCHMEYCLIGPLKPGLDEAYQKGFAQSLERLK